MATTTRRAELGNRIERIDAMVQRLESVADPAIRATATELAQSLLALHGAALERIVEVVEESGGAGQLIMEQLGRDELVRSVLVLYGLHPVDLETRVKEALEKARPYLRSHGGNVELVSITDGDSVRLRMQGSCHGCPSSALTLKMTIEDVIREAAPEVVSITVLDAESAPADQHQLPLVALTHNGSARPDVDAAWEDLEDEELCTEPGLHFVSMGGRDVLFCRLGQSLYAYNDRCPSCGQALRDAQLAEAILTCASCGDSYDLVKAGCGIDSNAYHLDPFPLLVENGRTRVALPVVRVEMGVT